MTQRIIDSWIGRLRVCERLCFQERPVHGQQLLLSWSLTRAKEGRFLRWEPMDNGQIAWVVQGLQEAGEEAATAF